ncbi:DUF4179 domain-containing protein [Lysinibacillus sp. BW-2-10]|uniref:DUF4179 domain-containing protein n=1 Tax=Lysinibacillus sp. BW-2-10 TaxID=2590030 RepID=UPI001180FCA2|nr:DUF4179 domain-containing protein [Lysinibacillus sp. BW-2-10]TSI06229.1 DUF4179 domain-containing protein [Lysinibacillus sp. BW-2-10]
MKNIYELLNEVEIDENEFVEMPVNEVEIAKLKRSLKKSIKKKKKNVTGLKMAIAAATITLSAISFVLTFPAYALNLPIVGDIFKYLDIEQTGIYEQYKENSTELNMTKEKNGIKVSINDAIFDGKTVALTYTIESEHDLGEEPVLNDFLIVKGENAWTGKKQISKVNENQYVGLVTASTFSTFEKDTVQVDWNIGSILLPNERDEVKGIWDFALSLEATDNNGQIINRSTKQNGVKVEISQATFTPMSFIVYYSQKVSEVVNNQWTGTDVDLQIKDDLGNSYTGEVNGGSGDESGLIMNWSKTFEKLDPKATKLIISPHIRLYENMDNPESTEKADNKSHGRNATNRLSKNEKTFVLEDIVIDLKK